MPLYVRLALLVALACAAVDSLLTRLAYAHRPAGLALLAQAFALWLAFALFALALAVPAARLAARGGRGGRGARARTAERRPGRTPRATAVLGATLLFASAAPVVAHGVLDRYTSLGGDVSALRSAGPWLRALLACAVLAALAWAGQWLARKLPAAAAGFGLAALALAVGLFASARGARLELEPARVQAGAEQPNVLFLVWDTTRAQNLSLFGYERKTTPYLARLADEALIFDNARSAAVFTLSSHLSMLTGVYPSHHGASLTRQHYDPRATPSVARAFRQAGYRTGGFVGTDVLRADTGAVDGFEVYDDQTDPALTYTRAWALVHDLQSVAAARIPGLRNNGNPHYIQDFQRPASAVLARAQAWIQDGDPRPWFCFVNLYDVHWPYVPSEVHAREWVGAYAGPIDGYLFRSDAYTPGYRLNAADKRHLVELYDGELAELDDEVERFLSAIDARSGEVALLLTSDHGEAFGEAENYEHFNVTEPQVHVPLLVRPAGGTRAQYLDVPTSGVDVAPTLLALAGLDPDAFGPPPSGEADGEPRAARLAGQNLLLAPSMAPRRDRVVLVENRDVMRAEDVRIAIYQGPWKLVRTGTAASATWQLFAHAEDPWMERDVAAENPDVVAHLRAAFEALRAAWNPRDEVGPGASNSDALEALGYMGAGHAPATEDAE